MKIFIASSNELEHERLFLAGEVCWFLNGLLCDRGQDVRVDPVKWEFLDSAMGVDHKQVEYNRALLGCDAAVVLFWRRFGQSTESEFRTALESLRSGGSVRRLSVLFKETDEAPSPELAAFRRQLRVSCDIELAAFATDARLRERFLAVVFDRLRDERPGFTVPDGPTLARYRLG